MSLVIYFRLFVAIALISIGSFATTVYNGYKKQDATEALLKESIEELGRARKTQVDIIEFNRKYNRVIKDVKDDCLTKPLPPALVKLRRK